MVSSGSRWTSIEGGEQPLIPIETRTEHAAAAATHPWRAQTVASFAAFTSRRRWLRRWLHRPQPLTVALAGLAVIVAGGVIQSAIGHSLPLLLVLPIVLVSALLGGALAGVIVGAGALGVEYILTAQAIAPVSDTSGPAIYVGYVLLFALVGEERRRRIRRADETAARLKAVEERVAKTARLNALGEVAGTLAHEINQPLSAIASFLAALQRTAEKPGADPQVLAGLAGRAAAQVVRAHQIITRVRNRLAGDVRMMDVDLAALLQATLSLPSLADRLDDADLDIAIAQDAAVVRADEVQLQQVLVNLIGNAMDAMDRQDRRTLNIASRRTAQGDVELAIADSGRGFSPEVEAKLFEPFTTSKPEGTGLGLAISRSIARSFCGDLTAHANPARGATFRLRLPAPNARPVACP